MNNDSWNYVKKDDLIDAVTYMCKKLNIKCSENNVYNFYDAIIKEYLKKIEYDNKNR